MQAVVLLTWELIKTDAECQKGQKKSLNQHDIRISVKAFQKYQWKKENHNMGLKFDQSRVWEGVGPWGDGKIKASEYK